MLRHYRFCWVIATLMMAAFTAAAGEAIAPDFSAGEPKFPQAVYGYQYSSTAPCVYRSLFNATPETECVALRLQTTGPVVVRVNGRLVYEHTPDQKAKSGPDAPAEIRDVVFAEWIRPGQNVLAISAAIKGLALEGAIIDRAGTIQRLSSSTQWQVKKFPPWSFLQHEQALLDPAADISDWVPVKNSADAALTISDQELQTLAAPAIKALRAELARNLTWRLNLIVQRGCIIDDWEPFYFGDASRLPDEALRVTTGLRESLQKIMAQPEISPAIHSLADGTEALTLAIRLLDEAECLANTAEALQRKNPMGAKAAQEATGQFQALGKQAMTALLAGNYTQARQILAGSREQIDSVFNTVEGSWKNVVNRLNQSDANRFGWCDITHLLDNDINRWGLRIGATEISWKMNLNGLWRFKLDPPNTGLQETYHDPAYNVLWSEIVVPGDWEHQGFQDLNPDIKKTNPFPGINDKLEDAPYNGWAWYRRTLHIPQEWAGYDLELGIGRVDDYDWAYFNGQEIGHTAYDTNPQDFWAVERKYKIPKKLVKFGGLNLIAVRVYDCRDKGGIMGDVEIRCPALQAAYEQRPPSQTQAATIWNSPLSVGALVTAGEDPLQLWGWNERGVPGPQAIAWPGQDALEYKPLTKTATLYDAQTDGDLPENWALLWPAATVVEQPILMVFLDKPQTIAANVGEEGTSQISCTFGKKAAQVVLARPFRAELNFGETIPTQIVERCRFWSQALLAYPIAFTEINERSANEPEMLDITDIYTYKILKDAWNTKPLKVALLPPFFSYAVEQKFPGLAFPSNAQTLGCSLGKYGTLKGVLDSDRVSYRVPLDEIPAFGGMTAFAFSPVDIGAGNVAEVRDVALCGGNSWRPQTAVGPGPQLQFCLDAGQELGVNILHNTSADHAGGDHKIPALYESLAQAYHDLPFAAISYDPFNEPAGLRAEAYNPLVRQTIAAIRKHDRRHLIYIESPESFASVMMLNKIEPMDDPLLVYSFHDYDYRLYEFWPNGLYSIRTVLEGWFKAFELMVERHARIHIGEWGGYEQRPEKWVFTRPHTIAQTLDMCRIFQHFNIHFHYYSNRGITRQAADGAAEQSYVQEGFRRFFARGHWNYYQKQK